jgi:single-strand DNA-binding protein
MNNLNSVLLEGKIEKEPVLLAAPEGKSLCTFTIASERYHGQPEKIETEVSSFDVEAYGHLAEVCGEYLKTGLGVRIVGRLKQEDGGVFIVAEHVEFKPTAKLPE